MYPFYFCAVFLFLVTVSSSIVPREQEKEAALLFYNQETKNVNYSISKLSQVTYEGVNQTFIQRQRRNAQGFDGKSSNGYDNEEALHQNIEEESEFIASRIRDGRGGSRRIKVEKLGNTLRKRVSKLRSREGVDLVFLVDSSASVGSQNFYNEIKFIRKLLADFTVSINTTRVVVITYSSVDRVIKQIDHISNPKDDYHKCNLLDQEIPAITYNSGGTYTLGALLQAIDVFQYSRKLSSKAVFLITDGYSNGGDPRPAAELLKSKLGVHIFTFGIRNGNVKELRDMASKPEDEHAYILDSFEEFEALARRALHEDISNGEYIPQPKDVCSRLCNSKQSGDAYNSFTNGYGSYDGANAAYSSSSRIFSNPPGSLRSRGFDSNFVMSPRQQLTSANLPYWREFTAPTGCCDPMASCSCGTHTGHFACVCPAGYYGRGLVGDCKRCPKGTYKSISDPGDIRSCIKCPHEHQTSPMGSNSVDMCVCEENYLWQNGRCTVQDCPQLEAPINGYFVHNECLNVFNSACGIRCNTGFDLKYGDSLRTCQPNGQWSGRQPICELRECITLISPINGNMKCQRHPNAFPLASLSIPDPIDNITHAKSPSYVDTQCTFSCSEGFRLVGSKARVCLPIALWTGIQASCKPIRCPRLRRPNYGEVYPLDCTRSRMLFGGRCAFSCHAGFQLQGPSLRECVAPGRWNGGNLMTRCVDVTPPVLRCPQNVTTSTVKGLHYAIVKMTMPVSQDNSGFVPTIVSVPALTDEMKFKIGTTEIKIGATDLTGNTKKCSFFVTVIDDEPPIVDFCRSPPIFLVDNPDDIDKGIAMIDWSEPIFHDNSVTPLKISRQPDILNGIDDIVGNNKEGIGMGLFPIGETVAVTYTAIDESGNNSTCKLDITVQEHYCLLPSDPINGHKNCSESQNAIFCSLSCEDGFSFAYQSLDDYFCPYNNTSILGHTDELEYPEARIDNDLITDYTTAADTIPEPNPHSNENAEYSNSDIEIVMAAHTPTQLARNSTSVYSMEVDFDYESAFASNIGLARPIQDVQEWLPESNPPPFPDCSVVSHSSLVVSMPTSMTFELSSPSGNEVDNMYDEDYYDQDSENIPQSACDDKFFLGKVSEALGSKIRSRLDNICTSTLNCELSELESLCEDVLEDEASSASYDIANENEPISRRKRESSLSTTQSPGSRYPAIKFHSSKHPRYHNFNPGNSTASRIRQRVYDRSRLKSRWALLRKKRRRRRRSRVKILFKMIGKIMNERERKTNDTVNEKPANNKKVIALQQKMKSMENIFKNMSSNVNSAIIENANPLKQNKQASSSENATQNDLNHSNRTSITHLSEWKVSSFETSSSIKPVEIQCKKGAILKEELCINCPLGSFHDFASNECIPCPKGSYQNQEAQSKCIPCPQFTSTREKGGAKTFLSCKGLCKAGTYSIDGLEPCTTCAKGFYQNFRGSTECKKCKNETSTVQRGAISNDACLPLCPKGYASETGLALSMTGLPVPRPLGCKPCPTGYFQELEGQKYCIECPNQSKSRKNKEATVSVYECEGITRINWNEESNQNLTKLEVDECFSNPCQNGGSCHKLKQSGFSCECKEGYGGTFCDIEMNYCASLPCMNGGTCSNVIGVGLTLEINSNETTENQLPLSSTLNKKFICKCPPEFEGTQCEWDVNECLISPCLNGGQCYNEIGSFECICDEGFKGSLCELEIDDCENHACQNAATCIDGKSQYQCQCPVGFSGQFCEQDIDECLPRPCMNGAMCVDGKNNYTCVCLPGYQGQQCETDVDECNLYAQQNTTDARLVSSNGTEIFLPCLNGGTCIDGVAKTSCVCPPGFDGNRCEKELDPNFVLVFGPNDFSNLHGGGTYEYALLGGELPDFEEFTFCFWMATDDKGNYGTPISYAIPSEDNEITFTDPFGFVLSVKGEKVVTDITGNDGSWTFMCASWKSVGGKWKIYKNGKLADEGINLAKGKTVKGKGAFVLGQEQDSYGGDFSSAESYHGKISQFNLWKRCLKDSHIMDIMHSCNQKDNLKQRTEMFPNAINQKHLRDSLIISWADFRRENTINGFVKVDYLPLCHGCPALSPPTHGYVRITPVEHHTFPDPGSSINSIVRTNISSSSNYKATYTCQEGYMLTQGDRVRTCGVLGDWRGRQPLCRLIECGFPGYLVNGYVLGASYLYGDIVRYTCRSGYRLYDGDATQRCARNRLWSGRRPTCKAITCRLNEPFPNGKVLNPKINYGIGQTIRMECKNSNYEMDGPSQLECLDDGTWSDMLPTCSKILSCADVPRISNGYVSLQESILQIYQNNSGPENQSPTSDSKNKIGFVKCNEGFVLNDPYRAKLSCHNGIWGSNNQNKDERSVLSEILPECREIFCKTNPFIQNARLLKQARSQKYNASIKFSCTPGNQFVYIEKQYLTGNESSRNALASNSEDNVDKSIRKIKLKDVLTISFKCSYGEKWISKYKMLNNTLNAISMEIDDIRCLPMKCDVPEAPQNGMVEFSGLEVGSMARYSCERQYELQGRAQRRCQHPEGTWSHQAPNCTLIQS